MAAIPSSPLGARLAFHHFGLLLVSVSPEELGFVWVRLCGGDVLPCLECCVLHCRRPVSSVGLYFLEGQAQLNGETDFPVVCAAVESTTFRVLGVGLGGPVLGWIGFECFGLLFVLFGFGLCCLV
ncbi:hypothetical protein RHMOL_Rhmol09G0171300 [Rhododendron molle]|uniref:Uncharacterized protein n=1 Tax=Rhododendron molle TaxID=49168 RepID=A0ACC0MFG2_RHOML|nr:hypothetical protein RHMOL_Rhmol09G0171300 [Rhododendron molle]